jgi:glycosyltransferase involved in cell wall biosynthesis
LKGHDVVLRAIPTVLARIPEAKFVFVGGPWGADGAAYFDEMQSLACELGVDGSVIFTGERRDVPQALASLDVALQCSLSENLGGSIEALLMERPLVVSAVGGLVDSVKDRETGVLVPPDDPRALADAIVELLQRPEFAKELGRNGRKFMLERFTVRFLADSLDNLYERCSEEEGLAFPAASGRYRLSRSIVRSFVLPFRVAPLWFRVMKAISAGRRFKRSLRALARWTAEAVVAIPVAALRGCRLLLRRKLKRDPARPLRIAQIVGTSVGCQWMIEIARGAKERGHDVCAVIDTAEGTLPERLSEAGIPYFRVPMTFAPRRDRLRLLHYALRVPLSAARLARVLRREKIDIVHSHIFSSMIMTRVAASLAGTPRVLSMIPGPRHLEAPLTRFVDRTTQRLDDVTIAGCRFTEEIYRTMHVSPDRIRCIYYGADPERFDPGRADGARIRRESGISADAPVVTLVAQFYPPMFGPQNSPQTRGIAVKGHDYFLAAARIVLAKFPSAMFLLVGGGHGDAGEAYRKRLMNDCKSLGIARSVIFTGHRDDVADLLAASDVAVQCSLSENLGGTIESLLMERATIATRVGGMPESVIHGRTGLLVPPADPAALANAIVRLLENRPFAQSLGRAGRQFMLERFTTQRMIADITALYESLLSDAIRDA